MAAISWSVVQSFLSALLKFLLAYAIGKYFPISPWLRIQSAASPDASVVIMKGLVKFG
jgi:hypothetical protein